MVTLTRVSIIARKIIRYGTYLIIFLFIARFLYGFGIDIYRNLRPSPPPDPTVPFGQIAKIPFPLKPNEGELSFDLQTPDGELPQLKEQLNVYFMPKAESSLQVLSEAKEKAIGLGFSENGVELAESI